MLKCQQVLIYYYRDITTSPYCNDFTNILLAAYHTVIYILLYRLLLLYITMLLLTAFVS